MSAHPNPHPLPHPVQFQPRPRRWHGRHGTTAALKLLGGLVLGLTALAPLRPTDAADLELADGLKPTIKGTIKPTDPNQPVVGYSAFGRSMALPKEWVKSATPANKDATPAPSKDDSNDPKEWLARGQAYLAREEFRDAESAFDKALALAPDSADARVAALRFKLPDLTRQALRKSADKIAPIFAPYRAEKAAVLAEYTAWLFVDLTLQIKTERDAVALRLKRKLAADRAAFLQLVAKARNVGHEYDAKLTTQLATLLGQIKQVYTLPASAEALKGFRFDNDILERLQVITAVAPSFGVQSEVEAVMADGWKFLGQTLGPEAVGKIPTDALTIRNKTVDETNAKLAPDVLSEREVAHLAKLNDYREVLGLPRLELSKELAKAARNHAVDMADHNYLSHTGLNKSTAAGRAAAAGFSAQALIGENIQTSATESDPVETILLNWLKSPGHHANICTGEFQFVGVGTKGVKWVQLFGTPKAEKGK